MKVLLTLIALIFSLTVSAQSDFTILNQPYKGTKILDYYQTLSSLKISPISMSLRGGQPEKIIEGNLVLHFFVMSIHVEDKIEKEVRSYMINDVSYSKNLITVSVEDQEYGDAYVFDISLNDKGQPVFIERLGKMIGVKYELPTYCLFK
jgi:hypothetical protein